MLHLGIDEREGGNNNHIFTHENLKVLVMCMWSRCAFLGSAWGVSVCVCVCACLSVFECV